MIPDFGASKMAQWAKALPAKIQQPELNPWNSYKGGRRTDSTTCTTRASVSPSTSHAHSDKIETRLSEPEILLITTGLK